MERVVFITAPKMAVARKLGRETVKKRLAACANLIPKIHSIYHWKGAVEEAPEVLLILKTTRRRLPALEKLIRKIHPYEVPEFIALKIDEGSAPYLSWIESSLKS